MSMSKKHYKAIAEVLLQAQREAQAQQKLARLQLDRFMPADGIDTCNRITLELARVFKLDNPRFDASRFCRACGLETSEEN